MMQEANMRQANRSDKKNKCCFLKDIHFPISPSIITNLSRKATPETIMPVMPIVL
jgi:hypothetical protein